MYLLSREERGQKMKWEPSKANGRGGGSSVLEAQRREAAPWGGVVGLLEGQHVASRQMWPGRGWGVQQGRASVRLHLSPALSARWPPSTWRGSCCTP